MNDAELCLAAANAAEVWKTAHRMYPTMTLDSTFKGAEIRGNYCMLVPNNDFRQDPRQYNPLRDDEQAMALIKDLHLFCLYQEGNGGWYVSGWRNSAKHEAMAASLNTAIVECAAKMAVSSATPRS
jgi:hypothetical protein